MYRKQFLPFLSKPNGVLCHFDICPQMPYGDRADNGSVVHQSAPDLNVEVLKGSVAVGSKDTVAKSRVVIDIPIKRLEVEVAPCATHVAIVS